MTSASDEKWRHFNCFFFQLGRAKEISAPLYVLTPLHIRWNQSFKFHISTGVSVVDTFYLFSNVLMGLDFLFEHISNLP